MIRKILLLICVVSFTLTYSGAQDTVRTEVEAFKISDITAAIEKTTQALRLAKSKFESIRSLEDLYKDFNSVSTFNPQALSLKS